MLQVVCMFTEPKTFMLLESATAESAEDVTYPDFKLVDKDRLNRVIDVREYGSERIFLSHTRGLGSVLFAHAIMCRSNETTPSRHVMMHHKSCR